MYTKCSQDMPCSAWFQSFHVTDWSDWKEIYKRKLNIALVSIFQTIDQWKLNGKYDILILPFAF